MNRVDTKKVAKEWGVSIRSAQNWVKAGRPVESPLKMANQILADGLGSAKAKSRAHELLAQHEGLVPGKGREGDDSREAAAPLFDLGPGLKIGDVDAEDVDLRSTAVWCLAKAKECAGMSPVDMGGFTYWHERYLKTEKAIRDGELHAKRMGLDEGQIITRQEFERLLFAMGFWMLRGVDVDLKGLAPKLVGITFVEEARGILDRYLMRNRFLAAFAQAVAMESGVSLPVWAVELLKAAVDAFWETDEKDPDDVAAYAAFQTALRDRLEGSPKSA